MGGIYLVFDQLLDSVYDGIAPLSIEDTDVSSFVPSIGRD